VTASREVAVREHRGLVQAIAWDVMKRMAPGVEMSDLVQDGYVGLLDALPRYRPETGATLGQFLSHRIRGAMVNGLRVGDPLSRHDRACWTRAAEAEAALAHRLGRRPRGPEVAAAIGMDDSKFRLLELAVRRSSAASEQDAPEQASGDGGPDELLERSRLLAAVAAALEALPERWRSVVLGHYGNGQQFSELADSMGVTPARVAQLHKKALAAMQKTITNLTKPEKNLG
jgi:RNA polymerase sigma factor FliA